MNSLISLIPLMLLMLLMLLILLIPASVEGGAHKSTNTIKMNSLIPLMLPILLIPASVEGGINCYQCADFQLESKSAPLGFDVSLNVNEDCRCGDTSKLRATYCPISNACSKSFGKVSSKALGVIPFSGTVTIRGCFTSTEDDCKQVPELPEVNKFKFLKSIKVAGTFCSCTGEACNGNITEGQTCSEPSSRPFLTPALFILIPLMCIFILT